MKTNTQNSKQPSTKNISENFNKSAVNFKCNIPMQMKPDKIHSTEVVIYYINILILLVILAS